VRISELARISQPRRPPLPLELNAINLRRHVDIGLPLVINAWRDPPLTAMRFDSFSLPFGGVLRKFNEMIEATILQKISPHPLDP